MPSPPRQLDDPLIHRTDELPDWTRHPAQFLQKDAGRRLREVDEVPQTDDDGIRVVREEPQHVNPVGDGVEAIVESSITIAEALRGAAETMVGLVARSRSLKVAVDGQATVGVWDVVSRAARVAAIVVIAAKVVIAWAVDATAVATFVLTVAATVVISASVVVTDAATVVVTVVATVVAARR